MVVEMLIGIVSDSHGRHGVLTRAIEVLTDRGAQAIVHCGDLGTPACVEALNAAPVAAYAVAGNMDRHLAELASTMAGASVTFSRRTVEVALEDGQFLVATHGHDAHLLDELVSGAQFPYVCHGHTHRADDRRVGPVRVICPGALRSPRGRSELTCALLNTTADTVELLTVQ